MNNNQENTNSSPMHLGMAGPQGEVNNIFSSEDIQELMGLMPSDQHLTDGSEDSQQQQHQQQQQHMGNHLESIHPPMHMSAVAVTNAALSASTNPTTTSLNGTSHTAELDEDSKNQARSERKRSREKQRRNDVNKQFGELTEVLKRIEAEEQQLQQAREEKDGVKVNQASRMVLPPFSPTNRVDLIARTIAHLERLSHVTKKQVQELQKLEEQLQAAQKAGEDMAQKLKDAVFSQQHQQGGMMMMANGMMGMNPGFATPMQMAMGVMNPMANATTNGMMSIQPQKQQVGSGCLLDVSDIFFKDSMILQSIWQ